MKFLLIVLLGWSVGLWAENNSSKEDNATGVRQEKVQVDEKAIKEQIEREKKYAKEQKFYQGDEYDLDVHKVDPKTLEKIPTIEPEYDFDMTDVYSD